MLTIHPEILIKNGKKESVVLPYEKFLATQKALADAEDLRDLRQAKADEGHLPNIPLRKVKEDLRNP